MANNKKLSPELLKSTYFKAYKTIATIDAQQPVDDDICASELIGKLNAEQEKNPDQRRQIVKFTVLGSYLCDSVRNLQQNGDGGKYFDSDKVLTIWYGYAGKNSDKPSKVALMIAAEKLNAECKTPVSDSSKLSILNPRINGNIVAYLRLVKPYAERVASTNVADVQADTFKSTDIDRQAVLDVDYVRLGGGPDAIRLLYNGDPKLNIKKKYGTFKHAEGIIIGTPAFIGRRPDDVEVDDETGLVVVSERGQKNKPVKYLKANLAEYADEYFGDNADATYYVDDLSAANKAGRIEKTDDGTRRVGKIHSSNLVKMVFNSSEDYDNFVQFLIDSSYIIAVQKNSDGGGQSLEGSTSTNAHTGEDTHNDSLEQKASEMDSRYRNSASDDGDVSSISDESAAITLHRMASSVFRMGKSDAMSNAFIAYMLHYDRTLDKVISRPIDKYGFSSDGDTDRLAATVLATADALVHGDNADGKYGVTEKNGHFYLTTGERVADGDAMREIAYTFIHDKCGGANNALTMMVNAAVRYLSSIGTTFTNVSSPVPSKIEKHDSGVRGNGYRSLLHEYTQAFSGMADIDAAVENGDSVAEDRREAIAEQYQLYFNGEMLANAVAMDCVAHAGMLVDVLTQLFGARKQRDVKHICDVLEHIAGGNTDVPDGIADTVRDVLGSLIGAERIPLIDVGGGKHSVIIAAIDDLMRIAGAGDVMLDADSASVSLYTGSDADTDGPADYGKIAKAFANAKCAAEDAGMKGLFD